MDYDLDFSGTLDAVHKLKGLADARPDLFESFEKLARSGSLFVCNVDEEAAKATGKRVCRYYPSYGLKMIVAAFTGDTEQVTGERVA